MHKISWQAVQRDSHIHQKCWQKSELTKAWYWRAARAEHASSPRPSASGSQSFLLGMDRTFLVVCRPRTDTTSLIGMRLTNA